MPPPSNRNTKKRALSLDRSNASKTFKSDYSVPTSNTYSALALVNQTIQPPKPAKPAPITVTDKTDFVTFLRDAEFSYRLKMVSIGTKIYVDKEEHFKAICDALTEMKAEFFTHPFGESKTFKLLLSGLPEFPTPEISSWLKERNNVTVNKITMLNSEGPYKRYLVQFNPKENNKAEIMKVKVILNHVIKWSPSKNNRKGPSQCLRCAMFGHGISACKRNPICLLCGDGHELKTCTFSNAENDTDQRSFKCYNCKAKNLQYNHKASDPLCPVRLKYIEIRSSANSRKKQTSQQQQQQYAHSPSNFPLLPRSQPAQIPPPLTRTFADAAKSTTNQHLKNNNSQRDSGDELFTFAEVSNILFTCINELEKCTTKFDQLRVIANLLNNVCK